MEVFRLGNQRRSMAPTFEVRYTWLRGPARRRRPEFSDHALSLNSDSATSLHIFLPPRCSPRASGAPANDHWRMQCERGLIRSLETEERRLAVSLRYQGLVSGRDVEIAEALSELATTPKLVAVADSRAEKSA
jgi:hypothetical protein